MQVKFKKLHPEAVIPSHAKPGDAGADLTVLSFTRAGDQVEYSTGLAVEIPEGYVGLIFPRSSIHKYNLSLTNSVGVIDSGYRGEIKFKFRVTQTKLGPTLLYSSGDRAGQLVIVPYVNIETLEVAELSSTERGNGGFGSSGQ